MMSATSIAIQGDFAEALFDSDRPLPDGLPEASRARRYAVHRNNVIKGLIDALRSRFPVTERIVGRESFVGMAQLYIRSHPPTSPVMLLFGDSFPGFAASFPCAGEMPYLADVCRIEAACTRAYHSSDATPLGADAFTGLDPASLMELRLKLHPSLELVSSAFPALTIWGINSDRLPFRHFVDWQPEDTAVVRPSQEVEVRRLPAGGAVFLVAWRSVRRIGRCRVGGPRRF